MATPTPASPPTDVRSQLVGPLLAYLRATGHDPAPRVERFGLLANAASLPEVSLPLATLHAFLDAAEALSGNAFRGRHVAQRVAGASEYGLASSSPWAGSSPSAPGARAPSSSPTPPLRTSA